MGISTSARRQRRDTHVWGELFSPLTWLAAAILHYETTMAAVIFRSHHRYTEQISVVVLTDFRRWFLVLPFYYRHHIKGLVGILLLLMLVISEKIFFLLHL